MSVDVLVATAIRRSSAEVSAYAGDPSNAPAWYANIRSVEWVPAERIVRTADGPFPMETTYTWEPAGEGGTR